jgi:hypothetical protein
MPSANENSAAACWRCDANHMGKAMASFLRQQRLQSCSKRQKTYQPAHLTHPTWAAAGPTSSARSLTRLCCPPQKLTSPQKKEWEALMVFLVQQVDPRWAPPTPAPDGKTKYEVCGTQAHLSG